MQKAESVLENETHKIVLDFEIQMDHIFPARKADLIKLKKRRRERQRESEWEKEKERENLRTSRFYRFSVPQSEHQRKREKWQIHGPCRRTKTAVDYEDEGDSCWSCCAWNRPQILGRRTWRIVNYWKSRDYQNYSVVVIGQKTRKSPGNLSRLTATQILVNGHKLTLVWKTPQKRNSKMIM